MYERDIPRAIHLCVWHDSYLCDAKNDADLHMDPGMFVGMYVRDMPHDIRLCVWHDSYLLDAIRWCVHGSGYVWGCMCQTCLIPFIDVCDMTYIYMTRLIDEYMDPGMCVGMYVCDIAHATHLCVWHESYTRDATNWYMAGGSRYVWVCVSET